MEVREMVDALEEDVALFSFSFLFTSVGITSGVVEESVAPTSSKLTSTASKATVQTRLSFQIVQVIELSDVRLKKKDYRSFPFSFLRKKGTSLNSFVFPTRTTRTNQIRAFMRKKFFVVFVNFILFDRSALSPSSLLWNSARSQRCASTRLAVVLPPPKSARSAVPRSAPNALAFSPLALRSAPPTPE